MPRHFAAIGLDVTTPEALKDLAFEAIDNGQLFTPNRNGMPEACFLWDMGRGIQIWSHTRKIDGVKEDEDYEITSCLPGFRSDSQTSLRAYRIAMNPEVHGEVFLRGKLVSGAEIQASLLNICQFDHFPVAGLDRQLHLSGLVLEGEIWDPNLKNDRKIIIEDKNMEQSEVNSMFVAIDSDCHYQLLGQIENIKEVVNFHTGDRLYAFGISTSELEVPLLAPASLFSRPPLKGDKFQGVIWLQAHLCNEEGQ